MLRDAVVCASGAYFKSTERVLAISGSSPRVDIADWGHIAAMYSYILPAHGWLDSADGDSCLLACKSRSSLRTRALSVFIVTCPVTMVRALAYPSARRGDAFWAPFGIRPHLKATGTPDTNK